MYPCYSTELEFFISVTVTFYGVMETVSCKWQCFFMKISIWQTNKTFYHEIQYLYPAATLRIFWTLPNDNGEYCIVHDIDVAMPTKSTLGLHLYTYLLEIWCISEIIQQGAKFFEGLRKQRPGARSTTTLNHLLSSTSPQQSEIFFVEPLYLVKWKQKTQISHSAMMIQAYFLAKPAPAFTSIFSMQSHVGNTLRTTTWKLSAAQSFLEAQDSEFFSPIRTNSLNQEPAPAAGTSSLQGDFFSSFARVEANSLLCQNGRRCFELMQHLRRWGDVPLALYRRWSYLVRRIRDCHCG